MQEDRKFLEVDVSKGIESGLNITELHDTQSARVLLSVACTLGGVTYGERIPIGALQLCPELCRVITANSKPCPSAPA